MATIRKAVFPVAGLGTRFLPATKANPKEMLPIVDKPLIQYAVEEAIEAGITELIFITNQNKRAIEDHFDSNFELEYILQQQHKENLLDIVQNILPKDITPIYIRQSEPKGLGHAICCAKNVIGNEAFAVLLADDLIDNAEGFCLRQMLEQYNKTQHSIIAVEQLDAQDYEKYGIVALKAIDNNKPATISRLQEIEHIVEKPKAELAPSNLGVVGRYILTPHIFNSLAQTATLHAGEHQLTDAIADLLKTESVFAYQFKGQRFDCGDKLGYLKAIVHYGARHKELGLDFRKFLKNLSSDSF